MSIKLDHFPIHKSLKKLLKESIHTAMLSDYNRTEFNSQ